MTPKACNHAFRPVGESFHKTLGRKKQKQRVYRNNRYVMRVVTVDAKSPNLTQTLFCSKCAITREITIRRGRQ